MAAVIQHEIADVLFIDVVGYSKRSINEQRAALTSRAKSFRAITKVCSKLQHEGSKNEPEQRQSEFRRLLTFLPSSFKFRVTNRCISAC